MTVRIHLELDDPVLRRRLTALLRADPEVVYAEPDQRRYIHTVPSDPLYAVVPKTATNPVGWPGQWYLMPSSVGTPRSRRSVRDSSLRVMISDSLQ